MSATTAFFASPVRKLAAKLTAAATARFAGGVVAPPFGAAPASASTTANWMMTGWGIHLANQIDPGTFGHFFNTSSSYGTGPNAGSTPVYDGFGSNAVLSYTSYAQFASDIQNNAISPAYKWVLYDPEMWSQTPLNEQQNPVLYLQKFGQLAHANGYSAIEVPARDLAHARPGRPVPPADAGLRLLNRREEHPPEETLHDREGGRPARPAALAE